MGMCCIYASDYLAMRTKTKGGGGLCLIQTEPAYVAGRPIMPCREYGSDGMQATILKDQILFHRSIVFRHQNNGVVVDVCIRDLDNIRVQLPL